MEATTKEGKKVLLHSDGRWEYASSQPAVNEKSKVFRNASWGDSKSMVKANETARLQSDENDYLWYSAVVGGASLRSFICLCGRQAGKDQIYSGGATFEFK